MQHRKVVGIKMSNLVNKGHISCKNTADTFKVSYSAREAKIRGTTALSRALEILLSERVWKMLKNDILGFLQNEVCFDEKWAIVSKQTRYLCVIAHDG